MNKSAVKKRSEPTQGTKVGRIQLCLRSNSVFTLRHFVPAWTGECIIIHGLYVFFVAFFFGPARFHLDCPDTLIKVYFPALLDTSGKPRSDGVEGG